MEKLIDRLTIVSQLNKVEVEEMVKKLEEDVKKAYEDNMTVEYCWENDITQNAIADWLENVRKIRFEGLHQLKKAVDKEDYGEIYTCIEILKCEFIFSDITLAKIEFMKEILTDICCVILTKIEEDKMQKEYTYEYTY